MYSLYIPKYKGEETTGWLLPKELGCFMERTEYSCDLLVSPGYLSETDFTIEKFLHETAKRITKYKETVGLGLFHGMNGSHAVNVGETILDRHNDMLAGGSGLTRIAVNPAKTKDHRKMIFFFEKGQWDITHTLSKRNMEDFLANIAVKAVLIGSSNFSFRTYFNGEKRKISQTPKKGEADLFMFADEQYMENVKGRISGRNDPGVERMVLFESIVGGEDPGEFFKGILRDFLTYSLN